MSFTITNLEILLIVGAISSILARRLRIPISVGLVIAGIILTFLPYSPKIVLTKDLIFDVFLPPLVFEGALSIRWKELRRDLFVVILLASLGVLLSTGITFLGMRVLLNWGWVPALTFGALIASTDPVSVISLFRSLNVQGRLKLLVEAESLFNDVASVVLFGIVLSLVGSAPHSGQFFEQFSRLLYISGGSVLCGFVVSWAIHLLAGRTTDLLVGNLLTFIAAFGSFILADSFRLSGILSCVVTGILIGNSPTFLGFSPKGRDALIAIWEMVVFIINSIIFILIGIRIAHQNFLSDWKTVLIAIVVVLLSRAGTVYPLSALFQWSRHRVETSHQHILFWGGLRGPLALALALGLPDGFPGKDKILSVSFAVVAFSIIVQGVTIGPVLKRLGRAPDPGKDLGN
ncbi:MAG: cation:proton antiporter [Leptospirales bacterium]